MHVAMISTSYVELSSRACFAALDYEVTCIDKGSSKVDGPEKGEMDRDRFHSRNVCKLAETIQHRFIYAGFGRG